MLHHLGVQADSHPAACVLGRAAKLARLLMGASGCLERSERACDTPRCAPAIPLVSRPPPPPSLPGQTLWMADMHRWNKDGLEW